MGAAASIDQLSSFKGSFQSLSDDDKQVALENAEQILRRFEEGKVKVLSDTIFVRLIRARNLRSADGIFSESDPYVLIHHGKAEASRSKTAKNERSPNWNEVLEVKLDVKDMKQAEQPLVLEVWDDDGGKGKDDPLGLTMVNITSTSVPILLSGRPITRELIGRGAAKGCSLTFMFWWGPFNEKILKTSLSGLGTLDAIESITSRIEALSPEASQAAMAELFASLPKSAPDSTQVPTITSDEPIQAAASVQQTPAIVTRKELRLMSNEDQERFANALETMMKNKKDDDGNDIKQSSEYFRLAGYHGWPNDFCTHRQETFPGWHRAYLTDFEQSLKKADVINGNDGNISLPYWDWTQVHNNEVMPAIIRKRFPSLPPAVLGDDLDEAGQKLASTMFSKMPDDKQLLYALNGAKLHDAVQRALEEEEHYKAASTRWRGGSDVESPHNSVHVACGFPMTSIYYAAFHPSFFLHHCNVDRVYEAYLRYHPDSEKEFAATQKRLSKERGEEDRFNVPLKPFVKSLVMPLASAETAVQDNAGEGFNEEGFMTSGDTFNTRALGYVYDVLPVRRPPQMRAAPTYVLFKDIDPSKLDFKSYQIHVFLQPSNNTTTKTTESSPSQDMLHTVVMEKSDVSAWCEMHEYAGNCGVFGGKTAETCANCAKSGTIYVKLEVSAILQKLGLSRHQASIFCVCVDEMGEVLALDATPLPTPTLEGPFFVHFDSVLNQSEQATSPDAQSETIQLQRALAKFGYYRNQPIDGVFGDHTCEAVKKFQKFTGSSVDGEVGPITKALLLSSRFDTLADIDESTPATGNSGDITFQFSSDKRTVFPVEGSTIVTFSVGIVPGYLNQSEVKSEISTVLMQWGIATGLEFSLAKNGAEEAQIKIKFDEPSDMDENIFRFDGPGGCIAHADVENKTILLDSSERWFVNTAVASAVSILNEASAAATAAAASGGSDSAAVITEPIIPNLNLIPCDSYFNVGAVVFHEFGHILGLCAHSPHAEDIMSPFYVAGSGKMGSMVLGPTDTKRIAKLYNDTPEVGLVLNLKRKPSQRMA